MAQAVPATVPRSGLLRVISPDDLTRKVNAEYAAQAAANIDPDPFEIELARHIRNEFQSMRNHRLSASGWNERLLHAMRVFSGEYDAVKMAEIQKFGGSTIFARMIAVKCRGASSLLRDVYLTNEKSWGLEPTPEPTLPESVMESIQELVKIEVQSMHALGQTVDPGQLRDRVNGLVMAARRAAIKNAKEQAKEAERKLDDYLVEGGFYDAFAQFLVDLPLFPFACIKGPIVRIVPSLTWVEGQAVMEEKPRMFWSRVSPFDLWWTSGVSNIEDAAVIERERYTRADLNAIMGLDGYNEDAIRTVLDEYGRGGLDENWDDTDAERAQYEKRENPRLNKSGLINCLSYHGNVQGRLLHEYGLSKAECPDEMKDYFIDAWLIGRYIIKVQISPSPRKRHPYYITSFEKVPGTVVGNALPDILRDIGDAGNACLRSLVNNMSIASGPQVVVNDDRLSPEEDGDELFPWKRWHVTSDPLGNNTVPPIVFAQPESRAQELLGVYEKLSQFADDISAIPRYVTGSERLGGAGRTASGLAMLMGNASKVLQTVAANIDREIFEPVLSSLYDMVMLTDESGFLRGDESIRVLGVSVAVQRETQRARQLEFLQATMNPVDIQIMGPKGRAKVLRSVASTIGLDGVEIIPGDEDLEAMAGLGQQPGAPGGPGGAPQLSGPGMAGAAAQGQGTQQGSTVTGDMGPRTSIAGGVG